MIPAGAERRLRGHVDRVLRSAHVPAAAREELAEELYGHLVERWQSLVRDGANEAAATERAIRDFGTADRIGRDLTRTYRGRFWASTIGVLLPASLPRGPQPRVAWWLGASLRFYALFYAVATVLGVGGMSPVRAVIWLVFGVAATALMVIAAMALRRRQRWALDLAIVVNVIGLLFGLYQMLTTPGLISLNVLFSGLLLLIAAAQSDRLGLWVRRSRPTRRAHALAILVVILGGAISPAAGQVLPDPTQATAADLELELDVDCDADVPLPPELREPLGRTSEPGMTVVVTARWQRTSWLPAGFAGQWPVDNLVVERMPVEWTMVGDSLTDAESGEEIPGAGGLGPGGPEVTVPREWFASVRHEEMRAGRTIRFEIALVRQGEAMPESPVQVSYWHANSFVERRQAGCS